MKKLRLTINDSELFETETTQSKVVKKHQRLWCLKFYFDNQEREQLNQLASFEVESDEKAIKLIVDFENKGCSIRAAFFNPSDKRFSSTLGFRFEYADHPYYNYLKNGKL